MEKTLISMTDFVLEQWNLCKNSPDYLLEDFVINIVKYATFLKQPLKLGMFVPCDENDVPLEEPKAENYFNVNIPINEFTEKYEKGLNEFYSLQLYYQDAKDRVLFEVFYMDFDEGCICPFLENYPVGFFNLSYWCLSDRFKTIEDLVKYNLKLTKNPLD